ncbi:MAG TPA: sensor domain-containing protein [Thermoanaerobaculia bacterium]|jgi:hypothetical protein|nr:sensor domain-containing protein [Thermoanaerobaculia bacterium]
MNDSTQSFRDTPFGRFLTAPLRARSYTNLLYLALAFPLGLAYFIFLVTGLSLGLGLTIIWIGLPILAAVFLGSFGLSLFERQLAIRLLGADVPPMSSAVPPPATLWARIKAFLANPATWKGMGYLAIKFPLGLGTFVLFVTLSSISLAFLLAPLYYGWLPGPIFDFGAYSWTIRTFGDALLCSAFGALLSLVTLNVFNGVAFAWGELAAAMLGSKKFAAEPAVA